MNSITHWHTQARKEPLSVCLELPDSHKANSSLGIILTWHGARCNTFISYCSAQNPTSFGNFLPATFAFVYHSNNTKK